MKFSAIIVSALVCLWAVQTEGSQCVCIHHTVMFELHQCQNRQQMPVAYIQQDGEGNNCMLTVANVITDPGWRAAIYQDEFLNTQQLVYFQTDGFVKDEQCSMQRSSASVTYDQTCTKLLPGTYINAPVTTAQPFPVFTTAPTTKSPATAKPFPVFTTAPAITATSSTKAPTVTASASTSSAPVFVTVPTPKPSSNCDWKIMLRLAMSHSPATHSQSRMCPTSSNQGDSEALLLHACSTPKSSSSNFRYWRSAVKVMDNCYGIPRGEPIAIFAGNGLIPIGTHAAFWKCTGTSFTIMYQSCATGYPKIGDVSTLLHTVPDVVFTIQW